MNTLKTIFVGIDAGSKSSGFVVLKREEVKIRKKVTTQNSIMYGFNSTCVVHQEAINLITKLVNLNPRTHITVVYEDIRPYTSKFSIDTIETCKQIGVLEYRMAQAGIECNPVVRATVKNWVFNRHREMATAEIEKEIVRLDKRNKDGELKKASFHSVGDRIVAKAMRSFWNVPAAKVGQSNIYGISKHSWQALAALTAYLYPLAPKLQSNEKESKKESIKE